MAYEVIARKWRPQQFDDVVGQEHVVRTLVNAIENKRLAHAYLFVGPRGIGKTSVARIFAKALNCEKGPTAKPCGVCDSCREITIGSSLDVMEIDGASNNSVDQIRDLRDTVKYVPAHGAFKIYIIDEVHMLSTAAFNALLKTLEEPPSHVKFFFATTEPEKVLPTIVSRCQRFDLRRIPVSLLVERLKVIAGAEKVSITDEALWAIARGAEGGLRDAESALDQLISFRGDKIVEEDVLSVFGLVSQKNLEELAERILTGDIKNMLGLVAELDRAGKDLQRLVLELMEHFRNMLVSMHVENVERQLDLTEAQIAVLKKQAALTDTARIMRVANTLGDTEDRMKRSLSRRTLLEMSLIRCARAVSVVSLEEILVKLASLSQTGAGAQSADGSPPEEVSPPARPFGTAAVAEDAAVGAVQAEPQGTLASDDDELAALAREWPRMVQKVGVIAPFAKDVMRDAKPASVAENTLTILLDAEFARESDKLNAARNKMAIERVISSFLRREVAVEFRIREIDIAEGPVAAPRPETDRMTHGTGREKKADGETATVDLTQHPAVKKIEDVFGGRVIQVRT